MWNMFHEKSVQYHLRSKNLLMLPETNTVRYGDGSMLFRGSILWNYPPNVIKSRTSVCSFTKSIQVERTTTAKFVNIEDVIFIL